MKTQEITGFNVVGVAVRTSNHDEMNPETAKISHLWQTFYSHVAPKLNENAKVYGVYTHYESDHQGFFDVIAGADTLAPDMLDTTEVINISIQSGKYLTFSATGKMPETVINLWQDVWQYFEKPDCSHVRAYTTDVEYYKTNHEEADNDIEILIAIK